VDEVRGTNLITVKVNYPDPTLAATIANSVADHAVQTARRVSGNEASHARDLIKEQLDLALKQLDAADLRLREYRQQARVEAVRKDVESRLGGPQSPVFSQSAKTQSPVLSGARAQSPVFPGARVPSVGPPSQVSVSLFLEDQPGGRPGLTGLLARIASEKARLVAMEAELAKRTRVDATTKSVDEVYQGLDAAAATTRSNLASLEQEKVELMGSRKLDSGTMAVLDHLYAIESDLARRQVDRDLAEANYVDLSQRYQEASLQVIGRSAEFVVIDPAVPADRPVPRHVARNTVVAAVAGFCLALAGVLLWHAAVRSQYVVR
jgi:uncharacterized protein involved in exopolysaccharide biosynthesis